MSKYKLRTRSITGPIVVTDGIRICVMRRIKPEYKFDIWLPVLGPSSRLLNTYIVDKSIPWAEFSKRYVKQLQRKKLFLELILMLLEKSTVTILCVEKKASRCHRFLLANECKKLNIKVKIKHV